MIDLLIYSLFTFGLWFIVGASKISLPVRVALNNLGLVGRVFVMLLECSGCFGFWEGLAYGYFFHPAWVPHHWAVLALITCATNLVVQKLSAMDDFAEST